MSTSTILAGSGTAYYANRIEPSWVDVHHITLPLPQLAPDFAHYRLVQISDLHADDSWHGHVWMTKERLQTVVELVNARHPDMIVITGDFITRMRSTTPEILSTLRFLQARDGIFAILGNHDHWSHPALLRRYLSTNNIHELRDSAHTIRRGNAELHLVGLDDLWPDPHILLPLSSHRERLTHILSTLPATGPVILLVHEPDFADIAASTGRITLQLSGHSHGGQVRIPLHGALKVPAFGQRYIEGLYHVQQMLHYTNRGIGMVSPHIRFDCRPEITVFTFQPTFHADQETTSSAMN